MEKSNNQKTTPAPGGETSGAFGTTWTGVIKEPSVFDLLEQKWKEGEKIKRDFNNWESDIQMKKYHLAKKLGLAKSWADFYDRYQPYWEYSQEGVLGKRIRSKIEELILEYDRAYLGVSDGLLAIEFLPPTAMTSGHYRLVTTDPTAEW